LRESIALDRLPAEAGDAAKVAVDAVDNLLSQLPQDELTIQMMKIAENRPDGTREDRPKRTKKKK
jgi:hypothetical protein